MATKETQEPRIGAGHLGEATRRLAILGMGDDRTEFRRAVATPEER